MPSSHLSTRPNRPLVVIALALAGWLGGSAASEVHAQQVLEVYGYTVDVYRPGTTTASQDIRPMIQQRGVNLDGSMRAGSTFGWALAGNAGDPGGSVGQARLGDVSLATGTYAPFEVDLALPAPGHGRWVVGRSHSHTQRASHGSHRNSNGPQGFNWFQTSQPEILVFDETGLLETHAVYLHYGADRFIEFRLVGGSDSEYKGVNGAAGVMQHVPGSPDVYIYTDQHGVQTYFFGGNTSSGRADYQVWKIVDPAGNTAYVGDASSASTAASSGYNSDKTIAVAYDAYTVSNGRRYSYSYSSIGGRNRLVSVVAEVKTGGTWASPTGVTEVGRVEYGYYTSDGDAHGKAGDLKLVTLTTPLSDSGVSSVKKKYYRYYDDTWSNSDGRRGADHMIKMVVGFEGCRNYDFTGDSTLDDDFLTETDANLKPYAEAYLEYVSGSDDRVASIFMGGQCGCGGGSGAGTHTLTYTSAGGFFVDYGYDTAWHRRVVIAQPDGTYITQYFDEVGQSLSRVVTDADPSGTLGDWWGTEVVRDASGRVWTVRSPANITGYTHSTGAFTASASAGLVTRYERATSGDFTGFVLSSGFRAGTGTPAASSLFTLTSRVSYSGPALVIGDTGIVRPTVATRRSYHTATDSDVPNTTANYDEATTTYTWWEDTDDEDVLYITLKSVTSTAPAVSAAKNGSASANAVKRYIRKDGTTAFTQSAEGYFKYTIFINGLLVKSITDCQTNHGTDFSSGDDPNTDFGITENGDGARLFHRYTYDAQGRPELTTMPDGHKSKIYYSKVGDGRLATLAFPPASSSSSIWYGPVSYSVSNHAGRGELSCTLGIASGGIDTGTLAQTSWVTEATADPLDALHADLKGASRAFVFGLSTTIHDKPGARVDESRSYFTVPTTGLGTAGTNFDATTFAYDDMGRRIRSEGPDGTISRTAYDDLGRAWRSFVGTNDNGEAGGDTSGTNNMVKVSETTFDGGSSGGNSLVTQRTTFVVDSTTDQRVTSFQHDVRGRTIVTENPQAPHSLMKYDNLGRMVASATYSSASGLDPSDDPTSLATNRLGLSQTFYDEAGRVYKSQRHQIDASDGSDDDHLATLTWYDRSGRVIKVRGEGVHTKTRYDRLGRAVWRFTLAKDDDASNTYSDVYDTSAHSTKVDGDHVLVEDQTYFQDSTGNALMQVRISRLHSNTTTTGELEADSDMSFVDVSAVAGRYSITGMVYDSLDRLTHTVAVGQSPTDWDRDTDLSTTSSDTNLVSQTVYNDNGTVYQTVDPKGLVTRFKEYDAAGRRLLVIANYVNGTPSGPTGDDDVFTRFVYSNGHQIKMWVDLDGDGNVDADDQVTEYVYGVTKGGSFPDSKIAHGGLLARVIYPPNDSGGTQAAADRDVWFAYNAQGQEVWREDQTELELQQDYDTAGRLTHRRATTMDTAGDLDTTVRRISYTYTSRGQTLAVTQYDNASPGSGSPTDEVKYTYDDWGNATKIEQDHNGLVGAGGSTDDYEVGYTYAVTAHTDARNMIRRTAEVLRFNATDEQTITYDYGSGGFADKVSRVLEVERSGTAVAIYSYDGEAELRNTQLPIPGLEMSTSTMDRFQRQTRSSVHFYTSSGVSPDYFFDTTITYDRNSNITRLVDGKQFTPSGVRAFDVAYTVDGLNRVTQAQEGHWGGSSITTEFRDELWTLTQTGNWANNKVDLNGDNAYGGVGELDDTRAHNPINEILTRNTNSSGGDEFTLAYNLRGDLEDEGGTGGYKYVWDAFGRLVEVRRQNDTLLAAYRYNGLNQRITWHYDADEDGDTDGSDPVYHFCYDDKWRIVGTWRGADTDPKEAFTYHNAGLAGRGGSSYIDTVVLRDRDTNGGGGWTGASDGTLNARHYYAQNWRADVSGIFDNKGAVLEWVKYSAYGVPHLLTPGDHDKSGEVDKDDETAFNADYGTGNLRADLDEDGDVDTDDQALFVASFNKTTPGGRWKLSAADVGNRKGYAGYEHEGFGNDLAAPELAHVRHRVLHFELGRWTRRDPLGYVDGVNLCEALRSSPIGGVDPMGLADQAVPGGGGPCSGARVATSVCAPQVPETWPATLSPVDCDLGISQAMTGCAIGEVRQALKACGDKGISLTVRCDCRDPQTNNSNPSRPPGCICGCFDPNSATVWLCWEASCPGPRPCAMIREEFLHAAQFCEHYVRRSPDGTINRNFSIWNDCLNTMCREFEAKRAINPAWTPFQVCNAACDSAWACFSNAPNGRTKPWGHRKCMQRCMAGAGAGTCCRNTLYQRSFACPARWPE